MPEELSARMLRLTLSMLAMRFRSRCTSFLLGRACPSSPNPSTSDASDGACSKACADRAYMSAAKDSDSYLEAGSSKSCLSRCTARRLLRQDVSASGAKHM